MLLTPRPPLARFQATSRELNRAQEELALIEERLAVADQHLAEDDADQAASARDLRVLAQQLSSMRLALVEARHRLAEQEARLAGSCGGASEGAGAAALLELQQCREDVAALRDGATAEASVGGCPACPGLAEVQQEYDALVAENERLQTRWVLPGWARSVGLAPSGVSGGRRLAPATCCMVAPLT